MIPEFYDAFRLKDKLMKQYEGKRLENVMAGKELVTANGSCYHIESIYSINLKTVQFSKVREMLISELRLIPGIGTVTQKKLRKQGIRTIDSLLSYPRYKFESQRFLELLDSFDSYHLLEWINKRLSISSLFNLYVSGLHRPEDLIFIDIETLGLHLEPIILIGIGEVSENKMIVHQYLARNLNEEYAMLTETLKHIKEKSAFVTFNGQRFDIPYVKARLHYHKIERVIEIPNFDVLPFSRVAWIDVPDHRLSTLEKLVAFNREEDVPSALVPEFYKIYMTTKNVGPLIPIIEHNQQDIVSLAYLFSKLIEILD